MFIYIFVCLCLLCINIYTYARMDPCHHPKVGKNKPYTNMHGVSGVEKLPVKILNIIPLVIAKAGVFGGLFMSFRMFSLALRWSSAWPTERPKRNRALRKNDVTWSRGLT